MENAKLLQVQVGGESTRGTAVAQTVQLMGITKITMKEYVEQKPTNDQGSLAPSSGQPQILATGATVEMEGRLSYEIMPILFDGLLGTATPSGSDPYTYGYNAPDTAIIARRPLTIAYGNSRKVRSALGCILSSLELDFSPKEYIMFKASFIGTQLADDTLDEVSPPTWTFPNNGDVTVSMGTYGGSLSALDCNVRALKWMMDTGTVNHYGVGSLAPCDADYGDVVESSMEMTVNGDYTALESVFENLLGASPTVPRREFQILVTDGTNELNFDMSAYLSNSPELYGVSDGAATLTLEFKANKDSSTNLTSYVDVSVTNGEATAV